MIFRLNPISGNLDLVDTAPTGNDTITLTGDVTGSGTSTIATTIATGVVTLAKMADMATSSLIYRKTAGTGVPEVNTLATLKTDLGLTGTNSGDQTITLSGDISGSGTGAITTTLATVNANVGSFGSSTSIPTFTVNAKGLVTAASGNVVIAPAGTLTGTTLAANVVTSSLTSVGTITTGTWNGTTISVAKGGTGITSGTSGGILGFTASGTLASSVALTASALVLGGGAGATPTPMASLGTTTTLLHGNAAGAPTFGAVSLTADVTGTLPIANGGTNAITAVAAFNNIGAKYTAARVSVRV